MARAVELEQLRRLLERIEQLVEVVRRSDAELAALSRRAFVVAAAVAQAQADVVRAAAAWKNTTN